MADLDTCRIPRETLAGLIATTNNSDQQRITAPIPVQRLDELLDEVDDRPAIIVSTPTKELPTLQAVEASSPDFEVRFRAPSGITKVTKNVVKLLSTRTRTIAASCAATFLVGGLILLLV